MAPLPDRARDALRLRVGGRRRRSTSPACGRASCRVSTCSEHVAGDRSGARDARRAARLLRQRRGPVDVLRPHDELHGHEPQPSCEVHAAPMPDARRAARRGKTVRDGSDVPNGRAGDADGRSSRFPSPYVGRRPSRGVRAAVVPAGPAAACRGRRSDAPDLRRVHASIRRRRPSRRRSRGCSRSGAASARTSRTCRSRCLRSLGLAGALRQRLSPDRSAAGPAAADRRRRLARLGVRLLPASTAGSTSIRPTTSCRTAPCHGRLGPRLRRRQPAARRHPRRRPPRPAGRRQRPPGRLDRQLARHCG